jgi:hypothetical protein
VWGLGLLPVLVTRDAVRMQARARTRPAEALSRGKSDLSDQAAEVAVDWLCRAHDAAGRRGCSRGFSLVHGWLPPYPETTGYIIGTLLAYAATHDRADLAARARAMGDWLLDMQDEEGGIPMPVGRARERYGPTLAFDTGMVMHGFLDLVEAGAGEQMLEGARACGRFLLAHQSEDGAWRGEHAFAGLPTTYHSLVAWALLRLGRVTGDGHYVEAGVRNLDWVVSMQRTNGWFDRCAFRPRTNPNTHGIAYTLQGLAEGYALTDTRAYLDAVVRTSDALIPIFRTRGCLPGVFAESWEPTVRYVCLTGVAQLGAVWLRLFQLAGESRFLEAGVGAVDHTLTFQERMRWSPAHGSLAGSFPIWGRYAPFQFPNWPTKFLVDGLMLRAECLRQTR